MITAEARDYTAGISVEVGPAGGLRSISLHKKALRLGSDALATTILDLVRTATATANQRAKLALPDHLREELSAADLEALGIDTDTDLADAVELTTPDTWMRR